MVNTPFNHVLHITPILEQIIEHFAPDWPDESFLDVSPQAAAERTKRTRAQRRILTGLACVCKTFMEPALKLRWQNLDEGIITLLRVLPAFKKIGSYCHVCNGYSSVLPRRLLGGKFRNSRPSLASGTTASVFQSAFSAPRTGLNVPTSAAGRASIRRWLGEGVKSSSAYPSCCDIVVLTTEERVRYSRYLSA
ncbi:uncharacterized protein B0H18DRAFT_1009874 [Fomitopsis serialis]|uniref:uncharacterized protein n=1 Tax=Fomitopsis serialis TaxID=139415 RepID=UPI002007ACE9|nr:uncharacterized protein B0H18DRAFT_1009874 [Neoantrodia serialis]KAH9925110.1 hypothetical protein B0H18DRAFT_1009874 [Neoantrodia serialis]